MQQKDLESLQLQSRLLQRRVQGVTKTRTDILNRVSLNVFLHASVKLILMSSRLFVKYTLVLHVFNFPMLASLLCSHNDSVSNFTLYFFLVM